MHSHAGHGDADAFFSETCDCAPESEVLFGILGGEEGYLDDGNGEWIGFLVEGYFPPGPDSMVETAAYRLGFDTGGREGIDDLLGNGWRAYVGEGFFVVV